MKKEEKHSNKCPICGRPTHKQSKYCIFHASAEEKTEEEFKDALKEYIDKIKDENKDYDFKQFIFVGNINFKKDLNITTFKNADFYHTNFIGGADFKRAIFKGNAKFWGATFEEVANFEGATFEKSADFRDTTFVGEAEFEEATFEEVARFEGATFEKSADFSESTFKRDVEFWGATFERHAEFWGATFKEVVKFLCANFEKYAVFRDVTFEGEAFFLNATFVGEAEFEEATFEEVARFEGATFEESADFSESTFKRDVEFWGAIFKGNAKFLSANFEKDAGFRDVTFEGNANFWDVTFEGNANFWEVTFKRDAFFSNATFKSDTNFRLKYLGKVLNLSKIKAFSGKKLFIRLNNEGGKIFFERAYLENTFLDINLVKDILIDFTDASLKNTKIKKSQIENHILQEKKEKFFEAQEIYLLLKNNFHSIGKYEDESWAFTKERDMEKMNKSFYSLLNKYKKYSLFKKILKQNNLLKRVIVRLKIFSKWLFSKKAIKWFNLSVSNFIYQYGESPWRVIRFALIVIFLFALILYLSGIVNSDRTNLIIEFIKESQGDKYTLKYLGPILGSFLNCLYFSVVTFTTLGYGDFQPAVGLSRFFVSLESIIGAITMALFVYTFARRTGGR